VWLAKQVRAAQVQLQEHAVQQAAAAGHADGLPLHLARGGSVAQPLSGAAGHAPVAVATDDDSDSDSGDSDSDDLLGLLTGGEASAEAPRAAPAAAAAAADGHPTSWGAVTGRGDDASDDEEGDADAAAMQAALAASRQAAQAAASARTISTVPGVSAAGLANEAGEYNCFLNVVVQCLWSCRDFRRSMQQMPPHQQEEAHPVVKALLQLFQQMEAAESNWQRGRDRCARVCAGLACVRCGVLGVQGCRARAPCACARPGVRPRAAHDVCRLGHARALPVMRAHSRRTITPSRAHHSRTTRADARAGRSSTQACCGTRSRSTRPSSGRR
jgi:hypothetical protein